MSRKTDVVSTAPLRTRAVGAKSFDALAGRLTCEFNQYANNKKEDLAAWNRHIPLTPRQALKILGRGLPKDTKIEFSALDIDGEGTIEFTLNKERKNGRPDNVFHDSRDFNIGDKTLLDGLITVSDDHQEKQYGRKIFRNQIEFFYACGVRKFEVQAASYNGGYTWARFGFLPEDVKDYYFKSNVRDVVADRYKLIRTFLPKDVQVKMDEAVRFKKKEDIWVVADCDTDLMPSLKKAFDKAARSKDIPGLTNLQRQELHRELREDFEDAASKGKSLKVGRFLLTGTHWSASIDMTNEQQMKRISDYTGGFKFIKFNK